MGETSRVDPPIEKRLTRVLTEEDVNSIVIGLIVHDVISNEYHAVIGA